MSGESWDDRAFLQGKARAARKRDEGQYQQAIQEALALCGALACRNNVGRARYTKSGGGVSVVPYGLGLGSGDLVVCFRGRYVEIETKALTKQSPAQVARARAVANAGGLYILARAGVDSVQSVVDRVAKFAKEG